MADFMCKEFVGLVKDILNERQRLDEIKSALLEEDPYVIESETTTTDLLATGENSYPTYPLYKVVATKLFQWMETSCHPSAHLLRFDLLEQSSINSEKEDTTKKVDILLQHLKGSWETLGTEAQTTQVKEILNVLDSRMLLDLMGVRNTVGSIDLFPPPHGVLVNTFCQKLKASSNLTVGARALSKHCHRDRSSMFWGVCSGSESVKNEHACTILHRILDDAAWINVHLLPHDIKVIEVRCSQGYGARWLHDGSEFRGFLEPQMADGHTVKWRH